MKPKNQKHQHLEPKNDFSLAAKLFISLMIITIISLPVNCYPSEITNKSQIGKNNSKISKTNRQKQTTTKITSESIHVKRMSGLIELRKNVVIEQDDTSLLSDSVDVYYKERSDSKDSNNKNDQAGSVEKIEANGNVKMFNQEFVVSGNKGWYDPGKKIFIVEGDVLLNRGTSSARGQKFVYNLNKKTGKLTGKQIIADPIEDNRTVVIINDEELKEQKKSNQLNQQKNDQ